MQVGSSIFHIHILGQGSKVQVTEPEFAILGTVSNDRLYIFRGSFECIIQGGIVGSWGKCKKLSSFIELQL